MEISKLVAVFEADTSNFDSGNARVESGLRSSQRAAGDAGASFSGLAGGLTTLGKTLSASVTLPLTGFVYAAVKSSGSMDSLKRGLTAVTGSSAAAAAQLERLKEVAKLPGLGFREAIQGAINLQAAGFEANLAERALQGFGNALATVGKGKAELDGVITALAQIASKGKISAEEINQLAERLPQIRALMKSAFGTADTEALQDMGISAEAFVGKITSELEKLPKVSGGITNTFENLADTIDQALTPVGNAINSYLIPVIDSLAPKITALSDYFASLSPTTQGFILAIGGAAAAIGPVVLGIAGLITAGTFVTGAFAAIGISAGAIIPILAAAAVGITALAGYGYVLYQAWQTNFGGIQEITTTVFAAVKDAVSTAMGAVSGVVSDIGGGMVNWWRQNYPLIQETVATVSNAIKTTVANLLAAIKGFWEAHGTQISGVVKSIWDTIKAIVTPFMQIIGNVIKLGMQVINGDWSGAWNTLLKVISQTVASVVSWFREMTAKSGQILLSLLGTMIRFSADAAVAMLKGIKDGVVWVVEALASLPAKIISLIPAMIAAGANIGSAIWKGLKDGLAGAAASAPIPAQITGMSGFMKGDSPSMPGGGGQRYTSLAQFKQANDTNTLPSPFGASMLDTLTAGLKNLTGATTGVKNLTGATGGLNKGLKDTAKTAKEISNVSFSSLLDAMRLGTAKQETGGSKNPLSIQNQRTKATGMFQIMPTNVEQWTRNTPGVGEMSVPEFQKSARAQILVFNKYMGDYLRKGLNQSRGNWEEGVRRAAAAWYGGEDNMKDFAANFGGKGKEPTFNKYTANVLNNTKNALKGKIKGPEFDFGSISEAKKEIDPVAEAIASFADQYARLNVTTREGEVRLDILKGKYGSLTPAIEKMLIASAAQMDMAEISNASFASTVDTLTRLNDAFTAPQTEIEKLNTLLRMNGDSTEEAARFNGVISAMAKMAEQAKLTAAEFGAMLRLKALVKDDTGAMFDAGNGRGTANNIGISTGMPDLSLDKFKTGMIEGMTPPPIAPWDTFFGGIIAGMAKIRASIPTVKQSLQETLIDLPNRAADVFVGAIEKFDGTLKGFFKSVVAGFAQMVKEILIEQLRLQVIKGITKIIGVIAGGIGGGGAKASLGGNFGAGLATGGLAGVRAKGGPVEANKPYVVGEREPELFVPKSSGRIYNGAQMAELGGSTVVNNSNNFNFYPDPQTGTFPKESAVQAAKRMAALTEQARRRA